MAQPWWEERVPPLSRRELFGAPWKGEGLLPLMGVAPQLQPLEGMLLRRSTDIYPKELARDMRQFFNSLLEIKQAGIRLTHSSGESQGKISQQEHLEARV